MRDDLLDAQAAIDWAKAQLQILKERIARWVRPNAPDVIIAEEDRGAGEDVLKVEIRNPLPRIFNAKLALSSTASAAAWTFSPIFLPSATAKTGEKVSAFRSAGARANSVSENTQVAER